MAVDTSQWRSSSTYDFVDGLAAADLAWEWLRRNADYQRDFANIERGAVDELHPVSLDTHLSEERPER